MKTFFKNSIFLLKSILIFSALILFSFITYSQKFPETTGSWQCFQQRMHEPNINLVESINTPKHSFDVLKYTLNVDLWHCYSSPYPHSYTANEIIKFMADTTLSSIKLNAIDTSLAIDSVRMQGISFTHLNDTLTITLDNIHHSGDTVSVKIYYRHLNVRDNAFYTGNGIAFTDCEPEGARSWFPCWDKPSDKALLDLTAKVPDSVLFGSNGRLQDSIRSGDTIWYHWISRDPIATYLMVMTSKKAYNLDIVSWTLASDTAIKIPMRFYYNTGENPSPCENVIVDMTNYYSHLFCVYPFEKGGFATLDSQFVWGGMENQTLISLCKNCWEPWLISHEFAHHWFGDMISPGTWADIFLNEGFATYCEALWDEHTTGDSLYKADIVTDANFYLTHNPGWQIYNPSWAVTTPPTGTLFNYAITYVKGASVLHMLRYVVGDTLFFHTLKQYASDTVDFKYKNAVIPDFITKVNSVCGQNLDWFFNEWLSEPNHPVYGNEYSFIDNGGGTWTVNFLAKQTQSNPSFFKMPVVINVYFNGGTDTTFYVMNDTNNQFFQFIVNKQPDSLRFDPNDDIVLKEGTTTQGIHEFQNSNSPLILLQNIPNPFTGSTIIRFGLSKASYIKLEVYDIYGKLVSTIIEQNMSAGVHEVEFSSKNIAAGVYNYVLQAGQQRINKKMVVM